MLFLLYLSVFLINLKVRFLLLLEFQFNLIFRDLEIIDI